MRSVRGLCLGLFFGSTLVIPAVAQDAPSQSPPQPRHFVVQAPEDVATHLEGESFQRWVLPNRPEVTLGVLPTLGIVPETAPDAGQAPALRVLAHPFPVPGALAQHLEGLPVRLDGESMALGGTPYDDPALTLAVRLPGEAGTSTETWVVSGHGAEATAAIADRTLMVASGVRFMGRQPRDDVDYIVRGGPHMERNGHWQRTESGAWTLVDARDDFSVREAYYGSLVSLDRPPVRLRVPPSRSEESRLRTLADDLSDTAKAMAARLGLELDGVTPIEVILERDFPSQGQYQGELGPAIVRTSGGIERLHLVLPADGPSRAEAQADGAQADTLWADTMFVHHALARWLLRRASVDLLPWLEDGAALRLSGHWYGRPRNAWLSDLVASDVLPTADELLATERQADGSSVLWPPVAAAILDILCPDDPTPGAGRGCSSDPPLNADSVDRALAELQREFSGETRTKIDRRSGPIPFQRGLSLAMHNGLHTGYHAPGIDPMLARLKDLGADSVSLMPFAYQPSASGPEMRFMNRRPTSETDVGTIHAARRAHAAGFRVLWKPHIWLSFDSWPGDIAMSNGGDWSTWFRVYRRYILHHAVLAEWTDSELFSIGVELGQTVDQDAEWRRLIDGVRRVYGGLVTYSGNWWADYDRVPFWDALDAVGVDAYFPLAHDATADRAALEEGARRAVDELRRAAERFGKPVILTEVGFSAREGAWVSPHEEGGTVSEEHQALAYDVLLDTLGRPPWLAGLYVWKVFSHLDAEGRDRPDFRFLGRQAEGPVREYFGNPGDDP